MNYPKRLIEVDLPIARISAHARREKSIRHGHISTLHIWWARRPLAACRAVICASLWPDPADELCPQAFREAASELLISFAKRMFPARINEEGHQLQSTASKESRGRWEGLLKAENDGLPLDPCDPDHQLVLRGALLDFIADFANWDNSTVPAYLETSRSLTQAAHEALGGVPGTRPLVADPFAGGGSIPLEALRVGGDAFASDLNPIPVLLNKVVLEYIPKYGQKLADEVRKWGQWIKERAQEELGRHYPTDEDGATPIAYLWARTIRCEGPGCGAEIPLIRTNQLFKKGNRSWFLKPVLSNSDRSISFTIEPKAPTFSTVQSGSATCPFCGYTTANRQLMNQIIENEGGSCSARLLAVVSTHPEIGRTYRIPKPSDDLGHSANRRVLELIKKGEILPSLEINSLRPSPNARGLSAVTRYGMEKFFHLYSDRQRLALLTFRSLVRRSMEQNSDDELKEAIGACLILAFGRLVDRNSTLCRWIPQTGAVGYTFGRQALSMVWDFVEINPLTHSGGWDGAFESIAQTLENYLSINHTGQAVIASATSHPLPDESVSCFITDPPYYDAIPYADLSDFFYSWMSSLIKDYSSSLFCGEQTPKEDEAIWNPSRVLTSGRSKDEAFYESQIHRSLAEGRRITQNDGIGVVVFAHKSTAGWEALLNGMIDAGWVVTGSWAIDTEREARTNAIGTSSLASSVHIVCRPRKKLQNGERDITGEWRDVLSELPKRIHEWMPRLAAEGVVGADAIFACLGPALEIFSRYSRVEKASGEAVPLREYLEQVWATVSTEALSMIFKDADAAGLEPDARLTAMWLWTLGGMDTNGNGSPKKNDTDEKVVTSTGYTLEYDAARKIAQGLGIHLEQSDSIVEVSGDKARLLPVRERTRHLFGKDEPAPRTARGRKKPKAKQLDLFKTIDELEAEAEETAAGELKPQAGETVLDRVHQSMILFASGRGEALRRFLVDDGAGNDARFWKLAQSLSALYPKETDEKRWVDGVLARKKGLGL
ncbi:DUF1156 domain-containing protein [Gimesia maris]|uniref:DUF1156 domain-containing protein n=1 Tax=Gimesia maris TaxID=122 RepID=UPI003C6CE2FE